MAEPIRASRSVIIPPAEEVRARSSGEVTLPETLDYRTLEPAAGGLFCERIFGPFGGWSCACGRHCGPEPSAMTCENCGGGMLRGSGRTGRSGHIDLAVPVCHLQSLLDDADRLSRLSGLSPRLLRHVAYRSAYVVLGLDSEGLRSRWTALEAVVEQDPDAERLQQPLWLLGTLEPRQILPADRYRRLRALLSFLQERLGADCPPLPVIASGGEALQALMGGDARDERGNCALIECLPVIPPDQRPLRFLDDRRCVIHHVNDLYRRVINRNTRLRRLTELHPPDRILEREKRRLQFAVDSLIDNRRSRRPVLDRSGRPVFSLADLPPAAD